MRRCGRAAACCSPLAWCCWGHSGCFWGVTLGPGLPKWPLALIFVFALGLAAMSSIRNQQYPKGTLAWLGQARIRRCPQSHLFFVLPYFLLPLLSLYALFGAILPQLTI